PNLPDLFIRQLCKRDPNTQLVRLALFTASGAVCVPFADDISHPFSVLSVWLEGISASLKGAHNVWRLGLRFMYLGQLPAVIRIARRELPTPRLRRDFFPSLPTVPPSKRAARGRAH